MTEIIWLFLAIGALCVGSILGYLVRQKIAQKKAESAEAIISKVKEKAKEIIDQAKKEETERRDSILKLEHRLAEKEEYTEKKGLEIKEK